MYKRQVIYILLAIGVVFAGLGVIGLFIFPDIRSRMFTGLRAALISCGSIVCAGSIYSFFHFFNGDGDQYAVFAGCAVFMLIITVILNQLVAREIQQHVPTTNRVVNPDATEPVDIPDTEHDE